MVPTTSHKQRAYIITGPTAGIGRVTAFEVAKHGAVVLVGRDRSKLEALRGDIEKRGGEAIVVVCDLSDMAAVQRAAAEIIALKLPIVGLINNAGVFQMQTASKSAQGWDMSFATNHLGPFVLTEALMPHLSDGSNIVFIASGVEDIERKPAKAAGFRGARYISAEASARGEWEPGGSKMPGADAYATSKQCMLATALEFARSNPRLRINAVEPGFNPGTSLGRDANIVLQFLSQRILTLFAPYVKYWSTPERAAQVITQTVLNASNFTGIYLDEKGVPMQGSKQVTDPAFAARIVAETRVFLANPPARQVG